MSTRTRHRVRFAITESFHRCDPAPASRRADLGTAPRDRQMRTSSPEPLR
jgi:hypothetical protein